MTQAFKVEVRDHKTNALITQAIFPAWNDELRAFTKPFLVDKPPFHFIYYIKADS
jgi:hypothetical protein